MGYNSYLNSIEMDEIKAVIIGSLHHNTLGVLRSLGEAGIPKKNIDVILVASNNGKNIISTSKYVEQERIAYVDDYNKIVPWLLQHSSFDGNKAIICCSDGASEAVIKRKEELAEKYRSPSTVLNVSALMEKTYQDKIAEECGLVVPISSEFITGQLIDWHIFPCIIKPLKSSVGGGKNDIRIVDNQKELQSALESIQSERIQVQQFISKEMEFQLIGCSLDGGKIIIIPGFTNIIRQPDTTNTGYLLYSPIDKLNFERKPVEDFIKRIGYSGLFSVEFIRGRDGKDYFLEINMRNDGNAYCVKTAGVNLPYIWLYYQLYGNLPKLKISFSEPVYFIPDFTDLKIAIHDIGIIEWIKQFITAQSHSIFNKNDLSPFIFEFWRQCRGFFFRKSHHHK